MSGPAQARPRSLRWRLLAATLVAALAVAVLAGAWLSALFRDEVERQFSASLRTQLDEVTARFELDAAGAPAVDGAALSDPRWQQPYSGLYWQVDAIGTQGLRARCRRLSGNGFERGERIVGATLGQRDLGQRDRSRHRLVRGDRVEVRVRGRGVAARGGGSCGGDPCGGREHRIL